ncbi:MAG: 2-oxoacid:ferredoxin oxidoreductase subunit beta, partial [Rhodospirillales bacterium]|nr:2-oxoacid:ferredoxin oxidoreductase subunit beta [Rhodospirillales bacterium]
HLPEVLKRAHAHNGTSFVEIFQNCIVFNNDVFADFTAREIADDAEVFVEHGKPLIFGKNKNRGIRIKPGKLVLEAVTIGENGVTEADILVHDETNRALAGMLAGMERPTMPIALGVLYCDPTPSYEDGVRDHFNEAKKHGTGKDLNKLLRRGHTWTVAG